MGTNKTQTYAPVIQDTIGENELLVISVGTGYPETRRLTIDAIVGALGRAFPEYTVCRGFTNQVIIDRIKEREGISIDNVAEALTRAEANGVKNLVIQPTHLMDGFEYRKMVLEAEKHRDAFVSLSIGAPLLTSEEDFQLVAEALVSCTAAYHDGKTAVCYMGHGTETASNEVYEKMQKLLWESGRKNYFIGTMEAAPTAKDILAMVKTGKYSRVILQPMMIVAGGHVSRHMAGDQSGSWKRIFESVGYQVVCVARGLGELDTIRNLLVSHAKAAIMSVKAQ